MDAANSSNDDVRMIVTSAQFSSQWHHRVALCGGRLLLCPGAEPLSDNLGCSPAPSRNVFVEAAVKVALAAASGIKGAAAAWTALRGEVGASLELDVEADNDFYSQRAHLVARSLPVCRASLASLPPALACPIGADGRAVITKTGLGSSAALTVSVIGAVLVAAGAARLPMRAAGFGDAVSRSLVHVAAQIAHGLAQGKVGSGFDVCSAAYGSVRYTRVRPAVLAAVMQKAERALQVVEGAAAEEAAAVDFADFAQLLVALAVAEASAVTSLAAAQCLTPQALTTTTSVSLTEQWCAGLSIAPFALPRGLCLMLADVAGGSETPGMVRQVLAWRDGTATTAGVRVSSSAHEPPAVPLLASLAALSPTGDVLSDATHIVGCFGVRESATREQAAAMFEAARDAVGPPLWRAAAAANARAAVVAAELAMLADTAPGDYDAALQRAASTSWLQADGLVVGENARGDFARVIAEPAAWRALQHLACALRHCRLLLRAMGTEAGVPIEPPEQGELADATARVPGVLASGVPGAGGYDALFAIVAEPASGCARGPSDAVEAMWLAWPGGGLTPLLLTNGPAFGASGAGVLLE